MKLTWVQTLCSQNQFCNTVLLASRSLLSAVIPAVQPTKPLFIPAVHSYSPAGSGVFQLPPSLAVLVDERYISSTKDDGLTLTPPTLIDYARTFVSDLRDLFPRTSAAVALGSSLSLCDFKDYIYLTFAQDPDHTLADGSSTSEGYTMEVTGNGVKISAAGAKGAFWATRTLLQGLVLSGGQFPISVIHDQPDWRTRGLMLGMYAAHPFRSPCARQKALLTPISEQTPVDNGIQSHSSRTSAHTLRGSK